MIERREDLCLAPEACHAIGIVDETVWQNLQRDITPELRIARAIHLSHAAGTNRREDLVGAESSTGSKSHKGGPDELVTLIVVGPSGPVKRDGDPRLPGGPGLPQGVPADQREPERQKRLVDVGSPVISHAQPALIGMEATGNCHWLVDL